MATDARLLSIWLPFCRHLQETVRAGQPILASGEPVLPEDSAGPEPSTQDGDAFLFDFPERVVPRVASAGRGPRR